MKKQALFGIAVLLIFTAALYAQRTIDVDIDESVDGDKRVFKIRKGGDFKHDLLNLTDAQKKDFKKLDLAFEKDILSLKNELHVARLELDVALDEDNPDLKKINGLIDSIHDKEAAIEKKRMATELKKRDLLTEGQKKNWKMPGPNMKKEFIMLRGNGAHDMMWFGDDEMHIPAPPKIKKEIEIINE